MKFTKTFLGFCGHCVTAQRLNELEGRFIGPTIPTDCPFGLKEMNEACFFCSKFTEVELDKDKKVLEK